MIRMRTSTVTLIAGIISFIAGAAIFILALFARILDPDGAGLAGVLLIILFIILMFATIAIRNKERADREE